MTGRLFIVGDIHGCATELDHLLNALTLKPEDRIIFLGDYIDRGPDAKGVIDRLLALKGQCQPIFLKGNHEQMFIDYLAAPAAPAINAFLWNGGDTTLRSYGLVQLSSAIIPDEHIKFLIDLKTHYQDQEAGILCVHAGLNPKNKNEQILEEMLWIREAFLDWPHDYNFTIIVGHTVHPDVRFDLPYKIGLDTGLVYGGKLSCLEWTEKKLYQIDNGSTQVILTDVSHQWEATNTKTTDSGRQFQHQRLTLEQKEAVQHG